LGQFTLPTWSYRFQQTQSASSRLLGTLVVVAPPDCADAGCGRTGQALLSGLDYWIAVVPGGPDDEYVLLRRHDSSTTWVQIIKVVLLLAGDTFMAFIMVICRTTVQLEFRLPKALGHKAQLAEWRQDP
jgi:cation/acetate symporter